MNGADDLGAETEFKNAAWYYPTPSDKAQKIKDYVAFCKLFFIPLCVVSGLEADCWV